MISAPFILDHRRIEHKVKIFTMRQSLEIVVSKWRVSK